MANVSSSNGLEKRPKLRFPGFDEPWRAAQLGNLLIELSDYATQESGFPLLTSSRQGLFVQEDYFIDKQANAETTVFSVLPYGCITYRHMSDDNIFHFNINRLVANGLVSKEYPVFTVRKEVLDTDFLVDTLNSSPLFSVFCIQQKKGGTRTRLYFKTLCSYQMFLPVLHEQQVIASFIRLLDKRFERQMELVETLKKYKRGVMQRIFRQLPSQDGAEWACVRLGDIFKKVSRRNADGVIKNVITNSAEYGLIPQRDFFDKDIAVDGNTANYYVIENGDFVYNPRKSNSAPYGPFNRYTLSEQGIISPLYTCLVLQADISPSYLAWYFKSDAWYRYIYDNGSQGVRHDRVSMTDDLLMGIPVMYPSHEKQLLYADILDVVETRLQATQKTLDLLSKTRDGYMRHLLF